MSDEESSDILKEIGSIVVAVFGIGAFCALGVMVDGFVISKLWSWFVVPPFGLALLTIPQAWGLALCARQIIPTPQQPEGLSESKEPMQILKRLWKTAYRKLLIDPTA